MRIHGLLLVAVALGAHLRLWEFGGGCMEVFKAAKAAALRDSPGLKVAHRGRPPGNRLIRCRLSWRCRGVLDRPGGCYRCHGRGGPRPHDETKRGSTGRVLLREERLGISSTELIGAAASNADIS